MVRRANAMPTKRANAVNGDLVTIGHPHLALDAPFTSFVEVAYRGVTHQVLTAADRRAFSYAHTTGEFTVCGLHGHVVEHIDTMQTQATHRYQAIVDSPGGVLSTMSYDSVAALLSFVGALQPHPTALGVVLDPDDECEYTSPPRLALELGIGVVEITPLTAEVIDRLPAWSGSPVAGGQLYGGHLTDESPYLTLVTPTARVVALPGPGRGADRATAALAGLTVDWRP